MFSNLWELAIVILIFGGSIFVHEFGHFVAAKWRGLKVLRFSIGFGPKLFSWKGRDGCVYMVSLLPFGGYVALPQLADMGALEGGDAEEKAKGELLPPASCTDKIIVSAAGAFFNVLLAALLALIVSFTGLPTNSHYDSNTVGYVSDTITDARSEVLRSPAKLAGILPGDKILSVDGKQTRSFSDVVERIALGSGRGEDGLPLAKLKISRGGKEMEVFVRPVLANTNVATGDAIRMIGVSPKQEMVVGTLMKDSPAEKAGLKAGDEVLSVNGIKLYSQQQLADILEKNGEDTPVSLSVLRAGKTHEIKITPRKIALTKPLCKVSMGKFGSLEFLNASGYAPGSECVKVFSKKIGNPYFGGIGFGDMLYAANGKNISNITQLNALVNHLGGREKIRLSFMSAGMKMKEAYLPEGAESKIIPPKERVMLGYSLALPVKIKYPSVPEQFGDAIDRTIGALSSLLNPKSDVGISSLAGPVDIGRVIYRLSLEDIALVLSFAVLLNINLAFLNMLPIPVLDGGHILFALIARLSGKSIPPVLLAAFQGVFSILLVSLMVYVVYIGFMRWSGDSSMESADMAQSEYYIRDISFKGHE